jgi:hypothetical protein
MFDKMMFGTSNCYLYYLNQGMQKYFPCYKFCFENPLDCELNNLKNVFFQKNFFFFKMRIIITFVKMNFIGYSKSYLFIGSIIMPYCYIKYFICQYLTIDLNYLLNNYTLNLNSFNFSGEIYFRLEVHQYLIL